MTPEGTRGETRERKISLFAGDMILSINGPKDYMRELLQQKNNFSNVHDKN